MSRIITIDGPSGSGKSTIAALLAKKMGWHTLDSGVLYRVLGFMASQNNLTATDPKLLELATNLDVQLNTKQPNINGLDLSSVIRTETIADLASQIAAIPAIRAALISKQRAFARPPGLIADGRDMGSIVFPDAQVKIFLTASPEERTKRRYQQLKQQGLDSNINQIAATIQARDMRDRSRSLAPLQAAAAAITVDTTECDLPSVLGHIWHLVLTTFPDLQSQCNSVFQTSSLVNADTYTDGSPVDYAKSQGELFIHHNPSADYQPT